VILCCWTPLSLVNCTSPAKHKEYMSAEYFCNSTGNRNALLGEKPISVPLSSPQIPHGLEGDLTRTPEVTARRRAVRAPECPEVLDYHSQYWSQVLMEQNRCGRQSNEETVETFLNSKHTTRIWISDVSLFWHFKLKQIPSTVNISYNFR